MFCDSLKEDEIYQAYYLYASLHGLNFTEAEIRSRIASYINNEPDETIDDAIFAFTEDCIVAPPDVVLRCWGKSRVYELQAIPAGGWRHQVCDSWFENGCSFTDAHPIRLAHFWTSIELRSSHMQESLHRGMRCQFKLIESGNVEVQHRRLGTIGRLPSQLAAEITERVHSIRFLVLIDVPLDGPLPTSCKLLVIVANASVPTIEVVEYASNAFTTQRNKC